MTSLRLWLPGPPVTWKRAQHGAHGGKFTHAQHAAQMEALQWEWRRKGSVRLCGPVLLVVRVYLPKPKKSAFVAPTSAKHGDWDNYAKLVSDALNGLAYHDDGGLLMGSCGKWWANPTPGTEILLTEQGADEWAEIGIMPIEHMFAWWSMKGALT